MHSLGYELPRSLLLGTSVNKSEMVDLREASRPASEL
jgi:hypothetical protein